MTKSAIPTSPWHIEFSTRPASATEPTAFNVSFGINSYGDGPKGSVALISNTTRPVADMMAAAPEMLDVIFQYRSDLKFPPSPDSVCRRLEMIDSLLKKIGV